MRQRSTIPRTDVLVTDDQVILLAEMPGVNADGIEVEVVRDRLIVRGRAQRKTPEGFRLLHSEAPDREYVREFTLGESVAREGITAEVKNGLLRVELPKSEASKVRRIDVRAA